MAQVLILDPPSELHFRRPFTAVVTVTLSMTNPTDAHMYFKVKTTAPRRYCVRPNAGCIMPRARVDVLVLLQPMNDDALDEKQKDKFLVQSVRGPADLDAAESAELFKVKENVMESRIKCFFLPAEGDEDKTSAVTSSPSSPAHRPTPTSRSATTTSSSAPLSVTRSPSPPLISTSAPYTATPSSAVASSHVAAKPIVNSESSSESVFHLKRELEATKEELKSALAKTRESPKATQAVARPVVKEPSGFSIIHLLLILVVGVMIGYLAF